MKMDSSSIALIVAVACSVFSTDLASAQGYSVQDYGRQSGFSMMKSFGFGHITSNAGQKEEHFDRNYPDSGQQGGTQSLTTAMGSRSTSYLKNG